jgi:hypothetical protein
VLSWKDLIMDLFLRIVVLTPTALVVVAVFIILWRERTTEHSAHIVITIWALCSSVLSYRGFFRPSSAESFPPIGVNLIVVFVILAASLIMSPTLRGLLTRQSDLISSACMAVGRYCLLDPDDVREGAGLVGAPRGYRRHLDRADVSVGGEGIGSA